MIDIHSHILWGLDDGAASLDVSLAMLRMAAQHGTTDIVATPHANLTYAFDPDLNAARVKELQEAAGPAPKIHLGCDYHFYPESVAAAAADPARFSINGRGYLLIEFPDVVIFRDTADLLDRLQASGLRPILTHPERNWLLHPRLHDLAAWVSGGLLLQITAQSLLGRFGAQVRRFSEMLIERGLAHFVASDAHDAEDRTPRLDEAYARVARSYGEDLAEHLFVVNPRCVLDGRPLPAQPEPRRRSRWFGWLR